MKSDMHGSTSAERDDLDALRAMSDVEFLRAWRQAIGEPPSIMLERDAMIAVLEEQRTATANGRVGPSSSDQPGSSPGSQGPKAWAPV